MVKAKENHKRCNRLALSVSQLYEAGVRAISLKDNLMELLYYPNKILNTICTEVEDPTSEDIAEQIEQMRKLIHQHNGIGLAAPQVGLTNRVFLVSVSGEIAAFINPVITEFSEEKLLTVEACLSIPGLIAKLKIRSRKITIKAYNNKGEEISLDLRDQAAVACQHELDHLNGITLVDRMPSVQKMMQLKKYNKLRRRLNDQGKKGKTKNIRHSR